MTWGWSKPWSANSRGYNDDKWNYYHKKPYDKDKGAAPKHWGQHNHKTEAQMDKWITEMRTKVDHFIGGGGTKPKPEEQASSPTDSKLPKMLNTKGDLVTITWACECGQPHWGRKKQSCHCCGKPRDEDSKWVRVPGGGSPDGAPAKRARIQGPLANSANMKLFQKLGFFAQENDDDNVMDLTGDEASPPPPPAPVPGVSPQAVNRAKAIETLNALTAMGATASIIQAAQAEVDGNPAPKSSQPLRDGARMQLVLAQHRDARDLRRAKQQTFIAALKLKRDALDEQIAKEEGACNEDEEKSEKISTEMNKAIIITTAGAEAAEVKEGERTDPLPAQTPTASQTLWQQLASRLEQFEAQPEWQDQIPMLKKAFALIINDVGLNEIPELPKEAVQEEANEEKKAKGSPTARTGA
jgi:hypothetical protein